jgi:hypothetical protein
MASLIEGKLTIGSDHCAGVDGTLAVWPEGIIWSDVDNALKLPNGELVRVGMSVSGAGGRESPGAAKLLVSNGGMVCDWSVAEIVVFNPGSVVRQAGSS